MKNFGDRLKAALLYNKMTQQELANRVGISQQLINYATTPRAKGSKHSLAMSKALGVSAEWLATGKGEMLNDIKYSYGDDLFVSEKGENYTTSQKVPLIEWAQITQPETHTTATSIACPAETYGAKTYAVKVKDNTMTAQFGRSYPQDAIIYIDPDKAHEAKSGDRVLALIDGKLPTFKLYGETDGERYLQSINLQYPIITKPFDVIGLVIGMWVPED